MTKWLLGPTLSLALLALPTKYAQPSQPASPITTQAAKACPSACSAQLTATEGKIEALQAQINQLRDAMNNDIPILNERTLDLNDRVKKLEKAAGYDRAMAELNDLDARVAQLERPEVEDDAK